MLQILAWIITNIFRTYKEIPAGHNLQFHEDNSSEKPRSDMAVWIA